MAKRQAGRSRKKNVVIESNGQAHIKATFNNVLITLTDQYGNTHAMKLNSWKPDPNWKSNAGSPAADAPEEKEDAPF